MNIHEYQAKELMQKFGVATPQGAVAGTPEEAEAIFFGYLVAGKGQGYVDDIVFDVVSNDVKTTGLEIVPQDRQGEPLKGLSKEPKNLDFEQ